MKTIFTLIVLVPFALSGCASTHPGEMGRVVRGQNTIAMKVSAEKQDYYSDDHYTFVTFTVENNSDDILRIKSAEIDFDPAVNQRVSVLVGNDLVSWATAEEEELKKSEHNKKVAQTALILGGLLAGGIGSATNNKAVGIVGGTAALGGAVWSLSSAISKGIRDAKNTKQVPDEHIYAPFSVPIEKFSRKWAVIQHPKGMDIKMLYLQLSTAHGSEVTYAIEI